MKDKELKSSELTLAPDGSLYHIRLFEEELADNIILVGDPDRVKTVSGFFDSVQVFKSNREICSATGLYKDKRITVISTGMGVDNIDIVLTEIDACKNIDLRTKTIKPVKKSLNLVRLGTTGALQKDMEINSYICSRYVIGIDGIMWFYDLPEGVLIEEMEKAFADHTQWSNLLPTPYAVSCSEELLKKIAFDVREGITITAPGFYGPQGRSIRQKLRFEKINELLPSFVYKGCKASNYEMETSAFYALSKALGHKALTICNVIANRAAGTFAEDYHQSMETLIETVLQRI